MLRLFRIIDERSACSAFVRLKADIVRDSKTAAFDLGYLACAQKLAKRAQPVFAAEIFLGTGLAHFRH